MPPQSHDPLTELKQAYESGHISAATYHAMAAAYRAAHSAASERGVAIGGDARESTILTGDHNRAARANTYIESQTVYQTLTEPQKQDRQNLLDALTKATMSFMMEIQFAHVQATPERYASMNAAYGVWEVESMAIKTRLRLQVKTAEVIQAWESFAQAVTLFYALAGVSAERQVGQQQAIQQTICQYLPVQQGRAVTWANLRAGLLEWHDQIVERLIESG
ncbi:MAG: hypothetical protein H6641_19265 [Caldilineaceae bacterium]|nr:hypothetical protein [Caldilineaceae bacterium]